MAIHKFTILRNIHITSDNFLEILLLVNFVVFVIESLITDLIVVFYGQNLNWTSNSDKLSLFPSKIFEIYLRLAFDVTHRRINLSRA